LNREDHMAALFRKGFVPDGRGGMKKLRTFPLPQGPAPARLSAPESQGEEKRLVLVYPPSVNRYLGFSHKTNRFFKTKEAKEFCEKVVAAGAGVEPFKRPIKVCLSIHIYRPRRQGDLTNFFKVLEDALQGIFYEKDSQIYYHIAKLDDSDPSNPRAVVACWPI
jgi:Holliday junction resolvase RusA-like endonuclease